MKMLRIGTRNKWICLLLFTALYVTHNTAQGKTCTDVTEPKELYAYAWMQTDLHPSTYELSGNQTSCRWRITAGYGYVIKLSSNAVDFFNLQSSNSSIVLYDGYSSDYPQIAWKTGYMYSSGNYLYIVFNIGAEDNTYTYWFSYSAIMKTTTSPTTTTESPVTTCSRYTPPTNLTATSYTWQYFSYSSSSSNQTSCRWRITADYGYVIQLSSNGVDFFNLQRSNSSIVLYDGYSSDSPQIAWKTESMYSSDNYLYIVFNIGAENTTYNFWFSYLAVMKTTTSPTTTTESPVTTCNGYTTPTNLTASSYTWKYIAYSSYSRNQDCRWVITVDSLYPSDQIIELQTVSIQLGYSYNPYGVITVRDGSSETYPVTANFSTQQSNSTFSSSGSMYVRFQSTDNYYYPNDKIFQLKYRAINRRDVQTTTESPATTCNGFTTPTNLTASSYTWQYIIYSSYSRNQDCRWVITVDSLSPSDQFIELQTVSIQLGSSYDPYGVITVRDGSSETYPLTATFSTKQSNSTFSSNGSMYVRFRSNDYYYYNYKFFQLNYRAISRRDVQTTTETPATTCIGYTNPTNLTASFYDWKYITYSSSYRNQFCIWVINVDYWHQSDQIIELQTVSIQLGYSYDPYGVITVHDGSSETYPVTATFSTQQSNSTFSSNGSMYVAFRSNDYNYDNYKYFQLMYRAINRRDIQTTTESPATTCIGYTNPTNLTASFYEWQYITYYSYSRNQYCIWVINLDYWHQSDQIIELQTVSIQLGSSYDPYGVITVRDGSSETYPVTATFSTQQSNSTFSSSGSMYVVFQSSINYYYSKYFQLRYRAINRPDVQTTTESPATTCNGFTTPTTLTASSYTWQNITYSSYSRNQYCRWVITVNSWYLSDQIIELQTVSIQLGSSYDPNGVITVHDGSSETYPVTANFSTQQSKSTFSSSGSMYVVFQSGNSYYYDNYKYFELRYRAINRGDVQTTTESSACSGYTNPTTLIASSYTWQYIIYSSSSRNQYCTWLITVDSWYASEQIIELQTESIQLGYIYDAYGVITVHDGSSETYPVTSTFSTQQSNSQFSSSGSMYIEFQSTNDYYNNKYFQLKYRAINRRDVQTSLRNKLIIIGGAVAGAALLVVVVIATTIYARRRRLLSARLQRLPGSPSEQTGVASCLCSRPSESSSTVFTLGTPYSKLPTSIYVSPGDDLNPVTASDQLATLTFADCQNENLAPALHATPQQLTASDESSKSTFLPAPNDLPPFTEVMGDLDTPLISE